MKAQDKVLGGGCEADKCRRHAIHEVVSPLRGSIIFDGSPSISCWAVTLRASGARFA